MTDLSAISCQSNNHNQRHNIKKLLYKATGKCQIKTPRKTLFALLNFTGEIGMDNFGFKFSSLSLFLFCNKPTKKNMTHVRLQLNSWTSHLPSYEPVRF